MCSQLSSAVITFCELQQSRSLGELREERLRFVCEITAGLYPAEFNTAEIFLLPFPFPFLPLPFSLCVPPSPYFSPFSLHNDSEHSAQRKQCLSAGPTKEKHIGLDSQAGQPRTGLLSRITQQVRQYDLLCP